MVSVTSDGARLSLLETLLYLQTLNTSNSPKYRTVLSIHQRQKSLTFDLEVIVWYHLTTPGLFLLLVKVRTSGLSQSTCENFIRWKKAWKTDCTKIRILVGYSREHASNSDTEKKKMLSKVDIFVFFAHKEYSRSFIKLRLNYWCHMDYFNDVLTTFLCLELVSCVAVYAGSESSRISSKIS